MTDEAELGHDELAAIGSFVPRYDDDLESGLDALSFHTPADQATTATTPRRTWCSPRPTRREPSR